MRTTALTLLFIPAAVAAQGSPRFVNQLQKTAAPCGALQFRAKLDAQNAVLQARMNGAMTSIPQGHPNDDKLAACYRDARERGAAIYRDYVARARNVTLREDAKNVYETWLASLGEPKWNDDGSPTLPTSRLDAAAARMDADEAE